MGKATGFIEYSRSLPVLRPPAERIRDWNEFHEHLSDQGLREQGARCMDCGVPFCHTGVTINGAASGCPLNNLIPEWNDLVFRDRWREALDLLHKTNNFPEFTGRVCPAPCEGSCVLGIAEDAVAIKTIECSIVDRGFAEGWIVPEPPASRTGWKVAVIGSGPSGLACAAQLNKMGHWVTVWERSDRVGGLLMYGIPNMKLDKAIVRRRLELLEAEGVRFVTNVEVGRDYATDRLMNEFDAVVLCNGATAPRDLTIENRGLKGVHFAMEFLRTNSKSLLDSNQLDGKFISAEGKDVIVIGGGDTGTDCVATALRHGCRSLVQFEIMDRPPESRAANNPWPEWPKIYRVDYGQEEAMNRYGNDPREYCVLSKKLLSDDGGFVRAIQTTQLQWEEGPDGRRKFEEIGGTERIWPAQLILIAMGFVGPERIGIISDLDLKLNERGAVAVDDNKMTSVPGVFAAGDVERGQSLVVWAISDGRRAAIGVDAHLSQKPHSLTLR
jgi:glutamate synthase (NADPH) small chain